MHWFNGPSILPLCQLSCKVIDPNWPFIGSGSLSNSKKCSKQLSTHICVHISILNLILKCILTNKFYSHFALSMPSAFLIIIFDYFLLIINDIISECVRRNNNRRFCSFYGCFNHLVFSLKAEWWQYKCKPGKKA